MTMKEIGAAEFKAHCLSILEEVDEDGLVITKRGRPVAKLVPIRPESGELIGTLAGKLRITGEILSTGAGWNAQP